MLDLTMSQTLLGLGMILVGLLMAIFSAPIAQWHIARNKRLFSVELPFGWLRATTVLIGALLSFSGLLTLLRLPPI